MPHPDPTLREYEARTIAVRVAKHLTRLGSGPVTLSVTPNPAGLIIGATIRFREVHVIVPVGWRVEYESVAKSLLEEARNGEDATRLATRSDG